MNLKAAAQKAGLDAASTGWAMLEKFALEADRAPEWNELWSAITEGKVRPASCGVGPCRSRSKLNEADLRNLSYSKNSMIYFVTLSSML